MEVRKMYELNQPKYETFQTQLDHFYVLGISHTENNPAKLGDFWGEYESGKNQILRDYVNKHSQPGNRLIGVMYSVEQPQEGYFNYITGGIVEGLSEIPDNSSLVKFPSTEFLVVTHEWVKTASEADGFIGMTVGHAHSDEIQGNIPDGYERYNDPVTFIERFNYNYDENKFRTEIWFAIRKI